MFNMIDKATSLTDEQINDLVAIIERNARTEEEADAATEATARSLSINHFVKYTRLQSCVLHNAVLFFSQ